MASICRNHLLWYTLLLKRWARLNSHPSGSKYCINSCTTKRGTWIPRRFVMTQKSFVVTEKSFVMTQKSFVMTKKSFVTAQKSFVTAQKSFVTT